MRPTTVLIRSFLQVHNIGDMAQGPGLISAIRRTPAPIRAILWPHGAAAADLTWFQRVYPEIETVYGSVDADGSVSGALREAFDDADILVHGSQGGAIYLDEVEAWRAHTTRTHGRPKPYGFAGITIDPWITLEGSSLAELRERADHGPAQEIDERALMLMQQAAFVFGRESITVSNLERAGLASLRGFGADTTFGFDLGDAGRGQELLTQLGLADEPFICLVPRLRYTPYASLWGTTPTVEQRAQEEQNRIHRADEFDIIRDWIRADPDGPPILICPEMSYAPTVAREEFNATTLGSAARRVHHVPDFWDPAIAAGVYARARLVVSMECHSPILALAAGTPAVYVRQPTDRAKGAMFSDVGLSSWTVELGATTGTSLQRLVDDLLADSGKARASVRTGMARATASIENMIQAMLSVAQQERSTSMID